MASNLSDSDMTARALGRGAGSVMLRQAQRIEELEIALRAALSYIQNQPCSQGNGHAEMVIAAIRGALRKDRD